MKVYNIDTNRSTLHGSFCRDYEPILTVASGDIVNFKTLDSAWGLELHSADRKRKRFEPRESPKDKGHALCGPIAINGAEPGMTLEIKILEMRTGTWGWSSAGGFPAEINKRLGVDEGEEYLLRWKLNPETMTGYSHEGHIINLSPFMGIMGMPPNEPGLHSTYQPRHCGGNLDCKELVVGSSLFLPIAVPQGLFSVGDGHAVQGDGEVGYPALECPMDLVSLKFVLHENLASKMPRAKTAKGWITFGFSEDLDEAVLIALDDMLNLLGESYQMTRKEALALASLTVDFRITQIVNGIKGVHAILPYGAIKKSDFEWETMLNRLI